MIMEYSKWKTGDMIKITWMNNVKEVVQMEMKEAFGLVYLIALVALAVDISMWFITGTQINNKQ